MENETQAKRIAELEKTLFAAQQEVISYGLKHQELEKERDELQKQNSELDHTVAEGIALVDGLRKQNQRLREALEFYADSRNYVWANDPEKLATAYCNHKIEAVAKEALADEGSESHVGQIAVDVLLSKNQCGTYTATAVSLPGAVAQGMTKEEAFDSLLGVVSDLIKAYQEEGREVPWQDNCTANTDSQIVLLPIPEIRRGYIDDPALADEGGE